MNSSQVIDKRSGMNLLASQGPGAADAEKITPEEQAFLDRLNTQAVVDCHNAGMIFDRRAGLCSEEYKLADFTCNRLGIQSKFADTGFQIVSVLDRALGDSTKPSDRGEGFLIDQCGVNNSGRYLVILVRPAEGDKITVREIQ